MKDKRRIIKITPELYKRIKDSAAQNRRTITAETSLLLEASLKSPTQITGEI